MDQWIDLLIARGSDTMVKEIRKRATVPVLGHGKGVCHVFVDRMQIIEMAEEIAFLTLKCRDREFVTRWKLFWFIAILRKNFCPAWQENIIESKVILKGDPETRKF